MVRNGGQSKHPDSHLGHVITDGRSDRPALLHEFRRLELSQGGLEKGGYVSIEPLFGSERDGKRS